MRAVIIYRKNTDYEREVDGFLREFSYRTGKQLEWLNPESREGIDFCRTYDVVQYPTILALDNLGTIQGTWRGFPLPLIDEVSYYVQ